MTLNDYIAALHLTQLILYHNCSLRVPNSFLFSLKTSDLWETLKTNDVSTIKVYVLIFFNYRVFFILKKLLIYKLSYK